MGMNERTEGETDPKAPIEELLRSEKMQRNSAVCVSEREGRVDLFYSRIHLGYS